MINYLIIDDEHIAHAIIQRYCDMLPNLKLQKNCYDALEAFEYLTTHQVDLIFLDLNMPKLKGFDFLKTLANPPQVIVTTAYSEHALEGYELNVVDYLLKPFSFERFLKAIQKLDSPTRLANTTRVESVTSPNKTIFLRSNKKHVQVVLDDIHYIEAAGNYTKVVLANETITIREKISDLIAKFADEDFLQVHKSYAVAIKHIRSIEGNQIFIGERVVPIGKLYKMEVNRLLGG